MQIRNITTNYNKNLETIVDNQKYLRVPIKTHVVMPGDNLIELFKQYLPNEDLEENDIVFISEKIVAISQGRALHIKDVHPRPLATFLSKYVTKSPHGIGIGMPETMEMALRECGTFKILLASAVAAVSKLIGRKGDFYRIAGDKARVIDGPASSNIPPFDQYVILGPNNPDQVSKELKSVFNKNITVVVADINDLGGNILGSSDPINIKQLLQILKDNPLGQGHYGTPLGIIRKVA